MSIGSWEADDASMSWHGDGVIRFVRLIGVCREGSMFATSRWATVEVLRDLQYFSTSKYLHWQGTTLYVLKHKATLIFRVSQRLFKLSPTLNLPFTTLPLIVLGRRPDRIWV